MGSPPDHDSEPKTAHHAGGIVAWFRCCPAVEVELRQLLASDCWKIPILPMIAYFPTFGPRPISAAICYGSSAAPGVKAMAQALAESSIVGSHRFCQVAASPCCQRHLWPLRGHRPRALLAGVRYRLRFRHCIVWRTQRRTHWRTHEVAERGSSWQLGSGCRGRRIAKSTRKTRELAVPGDCWRLLARRGKWAVLDSNQ